MAGKQDPMKNSGAVGSGSKQAEEFKVEVVAAFMRPQPLPRTLSGRHKLGEEADAGWMYGGLRPCTGSHVGTSEGRKPVAAVDAEAGGAGTGAKRKAGGSEGEKAACVGAAVDDKADQAAAAAGAADYTPPDYMKSWVDTDAGVGDDVKWVEMPLDYIAWLLAQKREDYSINIIKSGSAADSCTQQDDELAEHRRLILKIQADHEAGKEEFFAFQEWVRDTFDRNGCVMMPEHIVTRNEQLLEQVWEKARLGDD